MTSIWVPISRRRSNYCSPFDDDVLQKKNEIIQIRRAGEMKVKRKTGMPILGPWKWRIFIRFVRNSFCRLLVVDDGKELM